MEETLPQESVVLIVQRTWNHILTWAYYNTWALQIFAWTFREQIPLLGVNHQAICPQLLHYLPVPVRGILFHFPLVIWFRNWEKNHLLEKIEISCVSVLPVYGKSMHSAPSFLATDFLSWLYGHRVKVVFSASVPKIEVTLLLLGGIQVKGGIKQERINKVNPCIVVFLWCNSWVQEWHIHQNSGMCMCRSSQLVRSHP